MCSGITQILNLACPEATTGNSMGFIMIPSSNINLAVILVMNSFPIQTGTIGDGWPIVVYP